MLTLPNLLTLSRILAVPILVFLLWKPSWWDYAITFVLYCLVGITDYFDGYLARIWKQTSNIGRMLDPIADKLLVTVAPTGNRRCSSSRVASGLACTRSVLAGAHPGPVSVHTCLRAV